MKRRNCRAIPALTLLVAVSGGCNSVHRARDAVPHAATSGLQCQTQRVTGTLVPARVCTLKEQRDQIHQSTQDAQDFLNRQVISACPGSPGCSH